MDGDGLNAVTTHFTRLTHLSLAFLHKPPSSVVRVGLHNLRDLVELDLSDLTTLQDDAFEYDSLDGRPAAQRYMLRSVGRLLVGVSVVLGVPALFVLWQCCGCACTACACACACARACECDDTTARLRVDRSSSCACVCPPHPLRHAASVQDRCFTQALTHSVPSTTDETTTTLQAPRTTTVHHSPSPPRAAPPSPSSP